MSENDQDLLPSFPLEDSSAKRVQWKSLRRIAVVGALAITLSGCKVKEANTNIGGYVDYNDNNRVVGVFAQGGKALCRVGTSRVNNKWWEWSAFCTEFK